jgi:hypothetical protein
VASGERRVGSATGVSSVPASRRIRWSCHGPPAAPRHSGKRESRRGGHELDPRPLPDDIILLRAHGEVPRRAAWSAGCGLAMSHVGGRPVPEGRKPTCQGADPAYRGHRTPSPDARGGTR